MLAFIPTGRPALTTPFNLAANPAIHGAMPWRTLSTLLTSPDSGADRSLLGRLLAVLGCVGPTQPTPAYRSGTFTAAIVALSAKLSKSDGVALKIEEQAFQQVFDLPPHERDNIRRLWDLAKQDAAGFEAYARQVARMLEGKTDLKHDIFDALLHIATADGILHEAEDAYLRRVAELFGYSEKDYRALRSMFVFDAEDPYQILGLAHNATDAELKAHYLRLVKANHPDSLIARGVPIEYVRMAERKLAGINAAYDKIARERGL